MRRFRKRNSACSGCNGSGVHVKNAVTPITINREGEIDMEYQTIELQIDQHVATVWLNRPNLLNSFNETSIAELTDAFRKLGEDANLRAIVLAARGTAFSAGADLNWMKKMANYSMEDN